MNPLLSHGQTQLTDTRRHNRCEHRKAKFHRFQLKCVSGFLQFAYSYQQGASSHHVIWLKSASWDGLMLGQANLTSKPNNQLYERKSTILLWTVWTRSLVLTQKRLTDFIPWRPRPLISLLFFPLFFSLTPFAISPPFTPSPQLHLRIIPPITSIYISKRVRKKTSSTKKKTKQNPPKKKQLPTCLSRQPTTTNWLFSASCRT